MCGHPPPPPPPCSPLSGHQVTHQCVGTRFWFHLSLLAAQFCFDPLNYLHLSSLDSGLVVLSLPSSMLWTHVNFTTSTITLSCLGHTTHMFTSWLRLLSRMNMISLACALEVELCGRRATQRPVLQMKLQWKPCVSGGFQASGWLWLADCDVSVILNLCSVWICPQMQMFLVNV